MNCSNHQRPVEPLSVECTHGPSQTATAGAITKKNGCSAESQSGSNPAEHSSASIHLSQSFASISAFDLGCIAGIHVNEKETLIFSIFQPLQSECKIICEVDVASNVCLSDIKMASIPKERRYYVKCKREIKAIRSRNNEDHISWLIDHEYYAEVLRMIKKNAIRDTSELYQVFLSKYLNNLLYEHRNPSKAAELCLQLCTTENHWINCITIFEEASASLLPSISLSALKPSQFVYDNVTKSILNANDLESIDIIVNQWSSHNINWDLIMSSNVMMDNENFPLAQQIKSKHLEYCKDFKGAFDILL
ncbi:hypothetical protein GJ496_007341, partial [Pomphorhynchus laevis]